MHTRFEYIQPKNLHDAAGYKENSILYAGGTDVLGLMKNNLIQPEQLVNLKAIPNLASIEYQKGKGLQIGSMTTLTEIAANDQVKTKYPILARAASEVASPQLRNVGTLGGNLCQRPRCWYFRGEFNCLRKGGDECFAVSGENKYHCVIGGEPCFIVHPSDMAVALVALNASLDIYSDGEIGKIPAQDFFILPEEDLTKENILKPGEIITTAYLPELTSETKCVFLKFKERASWDFAIVSVAAVLQIQNGIVDDGRIVLGGVAPKPWLDEVLNKELKGLTLKDVDIERFAGLALQDSDPMDQNGYKVTLARNLIKKALLSFI